MGISGAGRTSGGLVAVVAICGLIVGACGSSSSSSKAAATPTPTPTPKATLTTNVDACKLVSAADASTAAGVTVTSPAAGAPIPTACIYVSADGATTVFVIANSYPDASSANALSPEQLAAPFSSVFGITNAKPVSGIGDKAIEYTATSKTSGATGAVIFVVKSKVVVVIAISPLTDTKKLEDLARTAVGNLP